MSADDKEPYFDGPHMSSGESTSLCNASDVSSTSYEKNPQFNANGPHSSNQFLNPLSTPPVVGGVVMYPGEFPSHSNEGEGSYQFKGHPSEAACSGSHQEAFVPANNLSLNATSNFAASTPAPNHASFISPVSSNFLPEQISSPTSSIFQPHDPAQSHGNMNEPIAPPVINPNEGFANNQQFGSYMNIANTGDQLYTPPPPSNDAGPAMMPFQPAPNSAHQEDCGVAPNHLMEGNGVPAPLPHMEFRAESFPIHPAPDQFQRNFLQNETRHDAEDSLHSQGTWPPSSFASTSTAVHLPHQPPREPPDLNQVPGWDNPLVGPGQAVGEGPDQDADGDIVHVMEDLNIEADYNNAMASSDDETEDNDEVCNNFSENVMVVEGGADDGAAAEVQVVEVLSDLLAEKQNDESPAASPPSASTVMAPPLSCQPTNTGSESSLTSSTTDLSCPHTAAHTLHVLPVVSLASSSPSHTARSSAMGELPDQQAQPDETRAFLDLSEKSSSAHAHELAEIQGLDDSGPSRNGAPDSNEPSSIFPTGISSRTVGDAPPSSSPYIAPCSDGTNSNAILDTHTMHSSYVSVQPHHDPTATSRPPRSTAADISVPVFTSQSGQAALPQPKVNQQPRHPLRSQMMAPETGRGVAASSDVEPHPVVVAQQPDLGKEHQEFNTMHANLPANQAPPPVQPNQNQQRLNSEVTPIISTNENTTSSNSYKEVSQSKENYLNPSTNDPTPTTGDVAPVNRQSQVSYNPLQPTASNDKPKTQVPSDSRQTQASHDLSQTQAPYDHRQTQAPHNPQQTQTLHNSLQTQPPYDSRQTQPPYDSRPAQPPYDSRPAQPPYDSRQTQPPYESRQAQAPYNDRQPQSDPPQQVPGNRPHEPPMETYYQPHVADRNTTQAVAPHRSHDNTQPPHQPHPSAQQQWDRRYDDSRSSSRPHSRMSAAAVDAYQPSYPASERSERGDFYAQGYYKPGYQHDRHNPRHFQRWPDQRRYDSYYRDYEYGHTQRGYGAGYEDYRQRDYYYDGKGYYSKQDARYGSYDRYSGRYSGGQYDDYPYRDYYGRHNQTYGGHQHRYHDDDDDRRSTYSEHSMHADYQRYQGTDHYNRSHDMHQPQYSMEDATLNESYYPNAYQDDTWQELPKVPPARRTPAKFTTCHPVARFGAGGHLVLVVPRQSVENQTSSVEIHNVETLLHKTKEAEVLQSFPGPLSRDETHKNDVVRFITSQSRNCSVNIDLIDRQSAALVWDFLGLLVRQNGSVLGTDIAELIMKDHSGDFTLLASPNEESTLVTAQADGGDSEKDEDGRITSEHDASEYAHGRESHVCPSARFRELLLYGRKKDALEWAMKSNLWGHALLLASKTDTRTHATVMLRFANSLPINDPLQTLYQLMSGRQPASATCVADEGWGDWRPHLSMILSNSTSNISLDTRVVMTMGDTMLTRGLIDAAHFCYLMASNPLGYYTKKSTKLVLLGSSHMRPFKEFATNQAIQRTETYEYAISLAAATQQSSRGPVHLSSLQLYKFMYACRLLNYGMVAKAFHYCENIAKVIIQAPTSYSVALVSKLSDLVECLKHHDSRVQAGTLHDSDLQWVQALRAISDKMLGGSIIPSTLSYTTQSTAPSDMTSSAAVTPHPHDDEESDETDDDCQEQRDVYKEPYGQPWNHQQAQYPSNQPAPPQHASYAPPGDHVTMQATNPASSTAPPPFVPVVQVDHSLSQATIPQMPGFYNPVSQPHQPSDQQYHQEQPHNQQQPYSQPDDLSPTMSSSSQTFSSLPPRYHNQPNQPPNNSPPDLYDHLSSLPRDMRSESRVRTVSQTSHGSRRSRRSRKSSGRRTRTTSEHSKRSRSRSTSAESEKKVEKKTSKKGWSIINWFKGGEKPKTNRVHLPDDSNKDIIWDDKLKKWVDVNATEEELAPPAPPPMDTPASNPVSAPSQPGQDATGQATLTSNRFSLKNLNSRTMYKNAFSATTNPPSSNVVPQPMIPALPQLTAPAMFIPTVDPNQPSPREGPTVGQEPTQPPAPTQSNPAQSGVGGQPAQTWVGQTAPSIQPQVDYQPEQCHGKTQPCGPRGLRSDKFVDTGQMLATRSHSQRDRADSCPDACTTLTSHLHQTQQQHYAPQQYQHPSQLSQQQVLHPHPDPPVHQHGSQPASIPHLQDNQPTATPPPAEPAPPVATFYNPAQFSGGPNLFSQPPVPQGGAVRPRGRGRYPSSTPRQ